MTTQNFKRLFFDIETSPNIGLFWQSGYKLNIPFENIINERSIICVAYKWEGNKTVRHYTWDKKQNDKVLLKNFINVMHEADEVVTHNGDRFDITWLRTRCIKHGIPMSPDFVSIDTLKAAKSKFRFNSNRLDYVARFLDVGKKVETGGFNLWKKVLLNNDLTALKKMVKYCENDVVLLEQVWDKMNPYLAVKSNRAKHRNECPECGGGKTTITKRRVTASGYHKIQFQCRDCGKYHTVAASRFNNGEIKK